MRIDPTTHEHGQTGKVYTYEGEYDVGASAITWRARVNQAEERPRALSGAIPITTPAAGVLADKAVHDAIIKAIDAQGTGAPRDAPPPLMAVQTTLHDALGVFIGRWRAEGSWHGAQPVNTAAPAAPVRWRSSLAARWHGGRYFVVQHEEGHGGDDAIEMLTVLGADAAGAQLFARCFDSRGLERRYVVSVDGSRWVFDGERERGSVDFSADGRTQHVVWQWRPDACWLPLSDRIAVRDD